MSKNQLSTLAATMLTDRHLAERLQCSRSFIWKLLSQGKLPEPIRLGRACRWRLSDIKLWEALECPSRDSDIWKRALEERDHAS